MQDMVPHQNRIGYSLIILVLLLCSNFVLAQVGSDIISSRYRQFLMETGKPAENVEQWLTLFNEKQQWNDLNYSDTERANWQLWDHLKRVQSLALAWVNPKSKFYHEKVVWKVINDALNHWLEKRYKNPNWWHNEIGIPREMRDILFLIKDDLSADQVKQALEVVAQYRLQEKSTGANLVWSADIGFHYGLLTHDLKLMEKCRALILKEIKISTSEGVQPDYSFHQHGARLQMFQYGAAFLKENVRLAWELRETSVAFPKEKIRILSDFVLNGWQWMSRGINTVPGTMDRSVSRLGELKSPDLRPLLPKLAEIDPENKVALMALLARQDGNGASLQGFRYYPYADFSVYQNKQFSIFLKTISTRTLATESINSENLKGKLLNSGDAYIVRDGNEYFNLMPLWDWSFLPGVTAFKEADHVVRKPFVGSVSDGKSGLTAMDYEMSGKETQMVKSKKIWACHDGMVVCLIAGLEKTATTGEVATSLDQCRWKGDVTVNNPENILGTGNHRMEKTAWIHHAGIAYIFINPSSVELKLDTVTGAWSSINKSQPASPVTEKIFYPRMIHTGDAGSGYVITACNKASQVAKFEQHPKWVVLRNDTVCQAVRFSDDTTMAAFFAAGTVSVGKKRITVDKPCLLLLSSSSLYACNPAVSQEKVLVTIGQSSREVVLPDHGITTSRIQLRNFDRKF